MSRKIIVSTFVIAFVLLFSGTFLMESNNSFASASEATKLKIYIGTPSVPADSQSYKIVFVQLLDSTGTPVRALQDMQISLSSSLTNIGTVDPSITIQKGYSFESASFYSTFTPGSTTITAAASGFATVQTPIATVGPIPSTLTVYTIPPVIPADGGTYPAIIVQLQDSSGNPARAPTEGLQITLSCSNSTVGTVDSSVTIKGGDTYAVANFKTNNVGPTAAGTAAIVSMASGYSSKQATITTQNTTQNPSNQLVSLKVYIAPPKVMADQINYNQIIAIQLQTAKGKIAKTTNDVSISLSSSADNVGTVEPIVTIPIGSNYAFAKFSSTYQSGTTAIMAAATDFTNAQQNLQTVGPVPSKIAVYCAPSILPSDNQNYEAIKVQLQDSQGKPAKDPTGDTTVSLFSSNPEAGNVTSTLTIPYGSTSATGTFYSGYAANSTTITAQASGYESGQAKMTTNLIDQFALKVTVKADKNPIKPGAKTNLTVYVTYEGVSPASGATVSFLPAKGINSTTGFSATKYIGNGAYTIVFTAPTGTKTTSYALSANVSKLGYTSGIGNITVTASPTAGTNQALPTGTIRIHLTEQNGNPINNAKVTSQTQPSGTSTLSDTTNSTGYVTFTELPNGTYTFQITKDGYTSQKQTLQVTNGQTAARNYNLAQAQSAMPLIIGALVAVIIVVIIIAILVIRKRRLKNPPRKTIFQQSNELNQLRAPF